MLQIKLDVQANKKKREREAIQTEIQVKEERLQEREKRRKLQDEDVSPHAHLRERQQEEKLASVLGRNSAKVDGEKAKKKKEDHVITLDQLKVSWSECILHLCLYVNTHVRTHWSENVEVRWCDPDVLKVC